MVHDLPWANPSLRQAPLAQALFARNICLPALFPLFAVVEFPRPGFNSVHLPIIIWPPQEAGGQAEEEKQ